MLRQTKTINNYECFFQKAPKTIHIFRSLRCFSRQSCISYPLQLHLEFDFHAGEDKSDAQSSSHCKHPCDCSSCAGVAKVCADVSNYLAGGSPRYCWQHALVFGKPCCPHWTLWPPASEAACLIRALSRKKDDVDIIYVPCSDFSAYRC